MAQVRDITDKLTFDENPVLIIKGKTLEVNADAPTVLRVMSIMGEENPGMKEINEAYELIFPEKSKEDLETLGIKFKDFVTVVQEAVSMIVGEDETPGER